MNPVEDKTNMAVTTDADTKVEQQCQQALTTGSDLQDPFEAISMGNSDSARSSLNSGQDQKKDTAGLLGGVMDVQKKDSGADETSKAAAKRKSKGSEGNKDGDKKKKQDVKAGTTTRAKRTSSKNSSSASSSAASGDDDDKAKLSQGSRESVVSNMKPVTGLSGMTSTNKQVSKAEPSKKLEGKGKLSALPKNNAGSRVTKQEVPKAKAMTPVGKGMQQIFPPPLTGGLTLPSLAANQSPGAKSFAAPMKGSGKSGSKASPSKDFGTAIAEVFTKGASSSKNYNLDRNLNISNNYSAPSPVNPSSIQSQMNMMGPGPGSHLGGMSFKDTLMKGGMTKAVVSKDSISATKNSSGDAYSKLQPPTRTPQELGTFATGDVNLNRLADEVMKYREGDKSLNLQKSFRTSGQFESSQQYKTLLENRLMQQKEKSKTENAMKGTDKVRDTNAQDDTKSSTGIYHPTFHGSVIKDKASSEQPSKDCQMQVPGKSTSQTTNISEGGNSRASNHEENEKKSTDKGRAHADSLSSKPRSSLPSAAMSVSVPSFSSSNLEASKMKSRDSVQSEPVRPEHIQKSIDLSRKQNSELYSKITSGSDHDIEMGDVDADAKKFKNLAGFSTKVAAENLKQTGFGKTPTSSVTVAGGTMNTAGSPENNKAMSVAGPGSKQGNGVISPGPEASTMRYSNSSKGSMTDTNNQSQSRGEQAKTAQVGLKAARVPSNKVTVDGEKEETVGEVGIADLIKSLATTTGPAAEIMLDDEKRLDLCLQEAQDVKDRIHRDVSILSGRKISSSHLIQPTFVRGPSAKASNKILRMSENLAAEFRMSSARADDAIHEDEQRLLSEATSKWSEFCLAVRFDPDENLYRQVSGNLKTQVALSSAYGNFERKLVKQVLDPMLFKFPDNIEEVSKDIWNFSVVNSLSLKQKIPLLSQVMVALPLNDTLSHRSSKELIDELITNRKEKDDIGIRRAVAIIEEVLTIEVLKQNPIDYIKSPEYTNKYNTNSKYFVLSPLRLSEVRGCGSTELLFAAPGAFRPTIVTEVLKAKAEHKMLTKEQVAECQEMILSRTSEVKELATRNLRRVILRRQMMSTSLEVAQRKSFTTVNMTESDVKSVIDKLETQVNKIEEGSNSLVLPSNISALSDKEKLLELNKIVDGAQALSVKQNSRSNDLKAAVVEASGQVVATVRLAVSECVGTAMKEAEQYIKLMTGNESRVFYTQLESSVKGSCMETFQKIVGENKKRMTELKNSERQARTMCEEAQHNITLMEQQASVLQDQEATATREMLEEINKAHAHIQYLEAEVESHKKEIEGLSKKRTDLCREVELRDIKIEVLEKKSSRGSLRSSRDDFKNDKTISSNRSSSGQLDCENFPGTDDSSHDNHRIALKPEEGLMEDAWASSADRRTSTVNMPQKRRDDGISDAKLRDLSRKNLYHEPNFINKAPPQDVVDYMKRRKINEGSYGGMMNIGASSSSSTHRSLIDNSSVKTYDESLLDRQQMANSRKPMSMTEYMKSHLSTGKAKAMNDHYIRKKEEMILKAKMKSRANQERSSLMSSDNKSRGEAQKSLEEKAKEGSLTVLSRKDKLNPDKEHHARSSTAQASPMSSLSHFSGSISNVDSINFGLGGSRATRTLSGRRSDRESLNAMDEEDEDGSEGEFFGSKQREGSHRMSGPASDAGSDIFDYGLLSPHASEDELSDATRMFVLRNRRDIYMKREEDERIRLERGRNGGNSEGYDKGFGRNRTGSIAGEQEDGFGRWRANLEKKRQMKNKKSKKGKKKHRRSGRSTARNSRAHQLSDEDDDDSTEFSSDSEIGDLYAGKHASVIENRDFPLHHPFWDEYKGRDPDASRLYFMLLAVFRKDRIPSETLMRLVNKKVTSFSNSSTKKTVNKCFYEFSNLLARRLRDVTSCQSLDLALFSQYDIDCQAGVFLSIDAKIENLMKPSLGTTMVSVPGSGDLMGKLVGELKENVAEFSAPVFYLDKEERVLANTIHQVIADLRSNRTCEKLTDGQLRLCIQKSSTWGVTRSFSNTFSQIFKECFNCVHVGIQLNTKVTMEILKCLGNISNFGRATLRRKDPRHVLGILLRYLIDTPPEAVHSWDVFLDTVVMRIKNRCELAAVTSIRVFQQVTGFASLLEVTEREALNPFFHDKGLHDKSSDEQSKLPAEQAPEESKNKKKIPKGVNTKGIDSKGKGGGNPNTKGVQNNPFKDNPDHTSDTLNQTNSPFGYQPGGQYHQNPYQNFDTNNTNQPFNGKGKRNGKGGGGYPAGFSSNGMGNGFGSPPNSDPSMRVSEAQAIELSQAVPAKYKNKITCAQGPNGMNCSTAGCPFGHGLQDKSNRWQFYFKPLEDSTVEAWPVERKRLWGKFCGWAQSRNMPLKVKDDGNGVIEEPAP